MSISSDNRDLTAIAAGLSASTRHFVRYYVEMVAVMFAGMGILMFPTGLALTAIGSSMSALHNHAPAAMLFVMAGGDHRRARRVVTA